MALRAKDAGIKTFPIAMHGEIDPFACFRIRALTKRYNYNIIHSHTSHAHTLAFFASFGTKVNRLVTRRVDFSIYRHSFFKLSGIKYRYMSDFYVAISHKIKEVMVADGIPQERIFVVHSGINPKRFEHSTKEHLIAEFDIKGNERVVINVAHLAGHKGQKYLVRAIPDVLAKMPNVRFFIVGGGKLLEELKDLSKSLGLGDRLVFTGFRKDVGAFYHVADLFVMSSVQEGLGTAVLDALALGKPVVGTNSGGIPEIIQNGETGLLVPSADPKVLSNAIVQILTDSELSTHVAEKGKAMVNKKFTVSAMVEKNIDVYYQILAKSSH
jgi:glycosyltransferase involved in cell wall biosynthesis